MANSLAIWISKNNNSTQQPPENSDVETISENNSQEKNNKEGYDENSQTELDLHFNYWIISERGFTKKPAFHKYMDRENKLWITNLFFKFISLAAGFFRKIIYLYNRFFGNNNVSFLDIGIKFKNLDGDINIYLPLNIKEDEYDGNLCNQICKEKDLMSTLFNNNVNGDSCYSSMISKITFFNKKDEDIYIIKNLGLKGNGPIGHGVTLHQNMDDGGCCLTFPRSILNIEKDYSGYFRFRLILNKLNREKLSSFYKAKDRFFSAKDEMIELIDFRVNESRNIPSEIKAYIPEHNFISNVHFFVIRDVNTEFLMSDDKYSRCRLLEGQLWEQYLRNKQYEDVVKLPLTLIYHWKKSTPPNHLSPEKTEISVNHQEKLDKYTAFAKFRYTKYSLSAIIRNIFVILILAVGANLIFSLLVSLFKPDN